MIFFKIPRGKEDAAVRNVLELTCEMSFRNCDVSHSVFIKMEEKTEEEKDLHLVKSPANHVSGTCASQQPASYRVRVDRFQGRGRLRLLYGAPGVAHCARDRSVCSAFQHPSDRLPPSARVATLPPVRRLRAADRGAAQATPPSALRDGGQPRGCQGPDGRPPCRSGMDSCSLPPGSSWATGPLTAAELLFGAY